MKLKDARDRLAWAFCQSCKMGMGGPREADDNLNDASRAVIAACHAEHGEAWLGKINRYAGDDPGMWEWKPGDPVHNFGADFVLPTPNEEIALLIGHYRSLPWGKAAEMACVLDRINEAIDEAGGVLLVWS